MKIATSSFRVVTVKRWRDLTPNMRRITLSGEDLGFLAHGGLHVRCFFPVDDAPAWPDVTHDGRPQWRMGQMRMPTRAYTVRHLRTEANELDLDFVLHGDEGAGSAWALHIHEGKALGIAGPIGRTIPPSDWYIIAGDETAIPPMGRILAELPREARGVVHVEVADRSEQQPLDAPPGFIVNWHFREDIKAGQSKLLQDAALAEPLPHSGSVFCWVGAESETFRVVRDYWRGTRGLDASRILAAPYWKFGSSHTKETDVLPVRPEGDYLPAVEPEALFVAWQEHSRGNDRARTRDFAIAHGATEAHLIAAHVGRGAVRLDRDWEDILKSMPQVGRVMALTRNTYAVHEKIGTFDRIMWDPERPVVLDPNINLRIRLRGWAHGFAVEEQLTDRVRHSLQIFDEYGVAVFKVYLQTDANAALFREMVARRSSEDQSRDVRIVKPDPAFVEKPDSALDAAALAGEWRAMDDTHDVFALARRHGASREQTYRLVPDDLARQIDKDAFSRMLHAASADKEDIMIFVGSPGNVQIHIGPVERIERRGPWQNVLDPDFNLHLLESGIASCWVVNKPTKDGQVTSVEIFDSHGEQIAWMFGRRKPGTSQQPSWLALVERVCLPPG